MSLRTALDAELATLGAEARVFDVHAHTGVDIDGTTRTSTEHLRDLDAVAGRSVIFPLCVAGGYEADNRRVLDECDGAAGRLTPFARLDPRVEGVGGEAAAAFSAGARGFKLHPRAEDFRLDHPGVEAILAAAAEARVPVLIHAGLGVGSFGPTLTGLLAAYPDCPVILAHAGITDLDWLWPEVPDHPNLFFDTSWWNVGDLAALFARIPPGRILFGSDAPYMDFETVLAITLRCARSVGLTGDQIESIVGGQLENLLDGVPAVAAGAAPGPPEAAPSPEASRAITAMLAAGAAQFSDGDPAQMVELARLAVGDGTGLGPEGPLVAELFEEGVATTDGSPWGIAMAIAILATPSAAIPLVPA